MSSVNVTFNLKTAGFANYANQTLTFKLLQVSADKDDSTKPVVLPGIITATSGSDGTGSVALFANAESDIESTFEVIFPNREKGLFKIPLSAVTPGTITLAELLVDHVPGGSDAPQSSVYDAAVAYSIQRANHTGSLTLDSLPNGSITGTLAVANGGTNASSASAARTSLDAQEQKDVLDDLGALSAPDSDGQIIVATGAGAFNYESGATARTSLGAQEQKDVLDDLGALSAPASDGQFIVATGAGTFNYESGATARTSLGLGTIATQALDSVNIDGGAIDGTVIGANNAAAVTGTTITASTKFAGAIDGTVGATTPAAGTFTSINVSDGNITNAGDINCDSISADDAATGLNVIFDGTDTGDNKITLTDNLASALDITESTNSYLKFTTTDSGEKVVIGKALDISGATTAAAVTGTNVLASAQSGYNTGGTITQGTSITTAVSLDQPSGVITLFANDFGANSATSFTLSNNFIDINDVVVASFKTGHSQLTLTVTATANNSCTFTLYNPTGSGTGSITAVINFAIIKTSTT